jgi:hypothetical protein
MLESWSWTVIVVLYYEDVDEDGTWIDDGLTIQFLYSLPFMILVLLNIVFVRIPYLFLALSLSLLLAPVGGPHAVKRQWFILRGEWEHRRTNHKCIDDARHI